MPQPFFPKSIHNPGSTIEKLQLLITKSSFPGQEKYTSSKNNLGSKYASLKIKDAIVDQFKKRLGKRPSVDRETPDHKFLVRISHDQVNLLWNTSGNSLFKRGYRTMTGVAPLNEVLAAGIIKFSGWDLKRPLVDPMCGSGTFICEALMIAKNIPPSIKRKSFYYVSFKASLNYHKTSHKDINIPLVPLVH